MSQRMKKQRLSNLEKSLIAATKGPNIQLSVAEIRKRGLVRVLRERARRSVK